MVETEGLKIISQEKLKEIVQAEVKENKVTCARLYELSKEHNVSLEDLGKAADELKVKITRCQLGCF